VTELPYKSLAVPADWDRRGLPAWTYNSEALFRLEREKLFLTHWQIVGHVNDLLAPGDFITFDMLGERAVIMRGQDGAVRAFHNLCRHRGARVVDGAKGHCRGAIVCPFHGWVYNLDGTLRGPAQPKTFDTLDRKAYGLKPIELEVFYGFIFIRFQAGPQPSVAELLNPYAADFAACRSAEQVPAHAAVWSTELPVNWKSVRDVDNEGYHVPLAHPSLQDLYGRDYRDIYMDTQLHLSIGYFNQGGARRWSVREYLKTTDGGPDLPGHLQNAWCYFGLFPNIVFSVSPEGINFYHDIPLSPGRTRLTGRDYRHPHETRRQRLARYLALRINRDTSREDQQLSIWSDESMRSSAFDGFHLSDLEWGLRRHHDRLRALIPVMSLYTPPAEAEVEALNTKLTCAAPAHG
jgi:phenylpropionate dioxygenase-like ring-hydroxylating dioxygenase large terminal subunit